MLSTDERQPFVDSLKHCLRKSVTRPYVVDSHCSNFVQLTNVRFEVYVTGLQWVANHEETRWFLVLQLSRPTGNAMNTLLWVSNETATAFGKPALYVKPDRVPEKVPRPGRGKRDSQSRGRSRAVSTRNGIQDCTPCFHVSIAWSHRPLSNDIIANSRAIHSADFEGLSIEVRAVKIKVGNVVTALPLSPGLVDTGGIIGV